MTVTVQIEKYDQCIDEGLPLLAAHYEEVAWRKDQIALDIDHDGYRRLEQIGLLVIYTAREDGKLIGYGSWIIQPRNLHYRMAIARNDVIYVAKSLRGAMVGRMILNFAADDLRRREVKLSVLHIKESYNWGRMAQYCGYEHVEASWWKWLGEDNGS
jgi:GNAT superfamily N-acetyltransferase